MHYKNPYDNEWKGNKKQGLIYYFIFSSTQILK